MDYEKKYKEALEDMRAIYPNLKGDAKLAVEHAFPELHESEEDEIRRESCMLYLANARDWIEFSQYIGDNARESGKKEIQKDIDWLKSLRPSWKPSEEQMEELNKVRTLNPGLDALYQQLKNI